MVENVIDPEEWAAFVSMAEPEILKELVDAYLDDAPKLIAEMHTGLANGDIDCVRRAAHSLKSNSASFGGKRLSEASRELELLARGGSLEGAGPKLADIEAEYASLSNVLKEMKNGF